MRKFGAARSTAVFRYTACHAACGIVIEFFYETLFLAIAIEYTYLERPCRHRPGRGRLASRVGGAANPIF